MTFRVSSVNTSEIAEKNEKKQRWDGHKQETSGVLTQLLRLRQHRDFSELDAENVSDFSVRRTLGSGKVQPLTSP
jgi:hypothetical protein